MVVDSLSGKTDLCVQDPKLLFLVYCEESTWKVKSWSCKYMRIRWRRCMMKLKS